MARVKAQCKDSSLINHKLPVEILTMIFLLLGPSSFEDPYVYLPLSWVCRRWRSIVLNTSIFWTVIKHECKKTKLQSLTRDVIVRFKPREIDIAWVCGSNHFYLSPCSNFSSNSCSYYFKHLRIRTLYLDNKWNFDFSSIKNLTQVENLILGRDLGSLSSPQEQFFQKFLSVVNPRFLELSEIILHKQISQSLPDRLEWLKISASYSTFPVGETYGFKFIIPQILAALPHLRILNLFAGGFSTDAPVINLPNLRLLSIDSNPHSIQTSALSYFGIWVDFLCEGYDWDHLNSIDLPMMKSLRIALCTERCLKECPLSIACISTGHSEEDCDFFNDFHTPVSRSKKSMDSHWLLPPPNSFHISFEWLETQETLFSQLKRRATNLVEFMVDCRSIHVEDWENWKDYYEFLGRILDTFDTVTHLIVLRSCDFVSTCNLLKNGQRLPRLERFTYHSSENPTGGMKIVFNRMKLVQSARIKVGSEPLKTLELKNFLTLSPTQVLKLEKKLGIHLEQ